MCQYLNKVEKNIVTCSGFFIWLKMKNKISMCYDSQCDNYPTDFQRQRHELKR